MGVGGWELQMMKQTDTQTTCSGCVFLLDNQQAHMGPGGCLEELDELDKPSS